MRTLIFLLVGSLLGAPQVRIPGPGGKSGAVAGYTGPGDVVTGAIAWWGLRCYTTAYAGNVADVWDSATGSTTQTLITCSAGGTLNETVHSIATTCASGCKVKTLYDQTVALNCGGGGASCDFSQATNSKRPTLTTSCIGSLYCMTFSAASSQEFINPLGISIAAQSQPYTFSMVVRQSTSVAGAIISDANVETFFTATPQIDMHSSSNVATSTVVNTWYAAQAVFNGASSVMYLNGSSNSPGNPGTAATSTGPKMGTDPFGQYLNGNIAEVGFWAGGFSGGQQSSMNSNQRAYWGF